VGTAEEEEVIDTVAVVAVPESSDDMVIVLEPSDGTVAVLEPSDVMVIVPEPSDDMVTEPEPSDVMVTEPGPSAEVLTIVLVRSTERLLVEMVLLPVEDAMVEEFVNDCAEAVAIRPMAMVMNVFFIVLMS